MRVRNSFWQASHGAAAVLSAMSMHGVASAQNGDDTTQAEAEGDNATAEEGSEFLGTIDLGRSTRAVQTDTAVPKTVIDREEIEDRQANTVAELIDSVPGVTLINGSTPIGSGINIRGFGANGTYGTDQKVAVQIDGASVGSEELYRIGTQLFTDPSLYRRAEVIRGTVGSFEYGSGIVGGVVRLETIDASDLTEGKSGIAFNQAFSGHSNEDGFSSSSTIAFMPSERGEFLANYTWREQGLQEDGNGDVIGNSAFELPSLLIKGGLFFGDDNEHRIGASFSQTETSERDKPYDSFGTDAGFFGNVDRDTLSKVATLRYDFDPVDNDLIDVEILLSYADQQIDQRNSLGTPSALLDADHRYETTKLTVKNNAWFDTGPLRHNLRAGVELIWKQRLDASSAPGGSDDRIALFAVDEIALTPRLTFTPAVRYESSKIEGDLIDAEFENDALMGGASLRYELPFGLAVFGSGAYTESLPILDDLNTLTPINYMKQSEKATTWEVGASYDKVGLLGQGDRAAFKINYYDTKLKDVTSYSGIDRIDLDGVEIEASYATAGGLYLDFNANIVGGTQTARTSGDVLDWQNLPADSYLASIGKRFGDTFNLRWESYFASEADRNGVITEGYDTHSLRAIITPQQGLLRNTALRLSVENLFDDFYTPLLATRPAPGRNFKASLSTRF